MTTAERFAHALNTYLCDKYSSECLLKDEDVEECTGCRIYKMVGFESDVT